jgi:hypothetical protein
MTKQSGLGDNLYVGGYNLSGNAGSLERVGGGPAPLVVTAIDKSAFERVGGQRDGGIDFSTWFDDAALAEHPALSTLPTTDRIVTYFRGTVLGKPAASVTAKQINYDADRGTDGSLSFAVQALANGYGLEWGVQMTAGVRTDTGAAAGTAVDFTAGTDFGLQAYLHVFSFAGTDVTIKLQESSDNSGDAYADVVGGGFTQVTSGPTSQRIATATNLTVERYLKVTTVTSGGFTSCAFAVMVVRNDVVPVF